MGFEVVYGQTKKKQIADRLVAAIQPLNLTGTLYIGYPVIASADEPVTVDSLLVTREHGLVAFETVEKEVDQTEFGVQSEDSLGSYRNACLCLSIFIFYSIPSHPS